LELYPAVRFIRAKKRGMPLPSGLGHLFSTKKFDKNKDTIFFGK
jgi:hypothetical protein